MVRAERIPYIPLWFLIGLCTRAVRRYTFLCTLLDAPMNIHASYVMKARQSIHQDLRRINASGGPSIIHERHTVASDGLFPARRGYVGRTSSQSKTRSSSVHTRPVDSKSYPCLDVSCFNVAGGGGPTARRRHAIPVVLGAHCTARAAPAASGRCVRDQHWGHVR